MRILALTTALLLHAGIAAAHPHIFVQAEVEIVLDDAGSVAGVRLTWIYDEFFSFLLTEDLGIDTDGDMVLTEEEIATLSASVLDWPADFTGDLFVTQDGQPLSLGPREDAAVAFHDGLVQESHYRPLVGPANAAVPVAVQVFDPFYYVAYEIVGMSGGDGCDVTLQKADLNAAYSLVDEMLYGRPASDVGPDEAFPEVGQAFSDTVLVTCAG